MGAMKKLFFLSVLLFITVVYTGEAEGNIQEASNNELAVLKENSVVKRESVPDARKKKRKKHKRKSKKNQGRKSKKSSRKQRRRRKNSGKSRKQNQQGKTKPKLNERKKLEKTNAQRKEKRRQKNVRTGRKRTRKAKAKKTGGRQNRKTIKKSKKGKSKDKIRNKVKKIRTAKNKNALKRNQRQANYTECVAKFMSLTKMALRISINVEKQVRTIDDKYSLIGKKNAKNGEFRGTYDTLLSALGGNKSAPECDGTPISSSSSSSSSSSNSSSAEASASITITRNKKYSDT